MTRPAPPPDPTPSATFGSHRNRQGDTVTRASRFEGTIGATLEESEAWFDEPPHPGADAPNVVVVLLDDTGFAQFGCYGSDIDTPNIDALAAGGLQFTNFHVTPLCSPTRASLLTGRSQHAVGMRSLANFRTGFPNQLGHVTNHAATVAEVLREEGYATFCVGKWHLAPMEQCSAAGPFDQWPLGRGFDRFYGFLEGETDQFHPELVCDNHPIDPPASTGGGVPPVRGPRGPGAADGVRQRGRAARPSVLPLPPVRRDPCAASSAGELSGEVPGPLRRGLGRGSPALVRATARARRDPRGHASSLPTTPVSSRGTGCPENQKRLACRLQEAFAAFLDHTDDQIGRLVEGLRGLGRLDNTVLIVLADNGASQEGGPFGVMHEMKFFNGILETPDEAIERLDDIGGPHSHTNYPWGWAQCGNAPFKWYKQNTHEGGVHVPLIVHAPSHIDGTRTGERRDQFVNVADIAPTIYDLVGVTPPDSYRGIDQLPVTGHSFASVLADGGAPATNTLQYFEMTGSRALVAGEWKAVCKHAPGADYHTEPWELYHLATDWSECVDLSADEPDRLAELIGLWWIEAERHGVLPLDDRLIELFAFALPRRTLPTPPTSGTCTARRCRRCPVRRPQPSEVAVSTSRLA